MTDTRNGILEFYPVRAQAFEHRQLSGEDAGGGDSGVVQRICLRCLPVRPHQWRKTVRRNGQEFFLQRGKEFLSFGEVLRYARSHAGCEGAAQRRQPGIALSGERECEGLGV